MVHLLKRSGSHQLVMTSATLSELKEGIFINIQVSSSNPAWALRVSEAPLLGQLYPEFLAVPKAEEITCIPETVEGGTFNLDDISLYLHSSGSTGLPKAIPRTHREIVNYIRFREYTQFYWALLRTDAKPIGVATTTVYRAQKPRVTMACMELPAFHAMAVVLQIGVSFFHGACSALFPPQVEHPSSVPVVPSPDNVMGHIERTKANGCFTIPAFLSVWAYDQKSIGILRRLKFVVS